MSRGEGVEGIRFGHPLPAAGVTKFLRQFEGESNESGGRAPPTGRGGVGWRMCRRRVKKKGGLSPRVKEIIGDIASIPSPPPLRNSNSVESFARPLPANGKCPHIFVPSVMDIVGGR